jgi:predicted DNA-binding protein with PD1-like motif
MKKGTILSIIAIVFAAAGCGNNLKTAQPSKSNKKPCPSVVTTEGDFSRAIVVRLKNGTDLLEGLREAVKKENIKNAGILSGIGSLTSYSVHVVDNNTFPTSNKFFKENTPVDILNVTGFVFDGRVHCHITVSNDQKAVGGHLEPGSKVFTFAIITIGVFDDKVNMQRFDDSKWR